MTSYLTQRVWGPVISPYFADDKGGFVNKTKCAGEQLKNNVSFALQAGLAGAGTVATAKVVAKNAKLTSKIAKAFDAVVKKLAPVTKHNIELVGESGKIFKTFELSRGKLAEKLLNLPGKAKAIGIIAAAGLTLLSYIGCKGIYKMGQIDQKYTDRAKIAV